MPEIYHVLSRGVDKRKIFLDEKDYFRFIHNLFEFNNQEQSTMSSYLFRHHFDIVSRNMEIERKQRKLLVDIHAFCLMPNHYHLLLNSKIKNGISLFMKKLNIGYVKYFNKKYKRTGTLFEGRFKSVLVKTQPHFIYLPYYIHLNPLDLVAPEWREKKILNWKKALKFLNSYRWSSHLDYTGHKNFPSITKREFLFEFFGNEKDYKKSIENWLKSLASTSIKDLNAVALDIPTS